MNFFRKIIEYLYLRTPNNLVYYDGLCGIYNRNYVDMVLKNKYYSKSCWVTFIDLNNLKGTNDIYGHAAGDLLLLDFVNRAKTVLQEEDVLCRLNGDEFIMITKDDYIDKRFKSINQDQMFSYGYTFKKTNESLSDAMKRADSLMYKMKSAYHKNH